MKNSFAVTQENILTRRFGGTTVGVGDPYVTGYHHIWFDHLPRGIEILTDETSGEMATKPEMQNILAATCLSVTPPGGTVNKVEFTGLGGIKWAVPGSIDYGNSISLKFFEMQGTPILSIMHSWVKMMRDYRTGISNLRDTEADLQVYSKKTYGAVLYYWTTAPDGVTIDYYACYDGVFPTKDPQDLFTSDVETVGKLDVEIEFNVDYAWHEKWVYDKCKSFSNNAIGGDGLVKSYRP